MSNGSNQLTCIQCDEPLEPGWTECPACGVATSSDLLCPQCNSPIKPHWKKCPYCMKTLSGNVTPSQVPNTPGRMSEMGAISMAVAVQQEAELNKGVELPIGKGDVLGERYTVMQSLGVGGFGAVYLVEDAVLKEKRALKVVVTGEGKAERATEQLLHEFRLRERITETEYIVTAQDPRQQNLKGFLWCYCQWCWQKVAVCGDGSGRTKAMRNG